MPRAPREGGSTEPDRLYRGGGDGERELKRRRALLGGDGERDKGRRLEAAGGGEGEREEGGPRCESLSMSEGDRRRGGGLLLRLSR